MVCCRLVLVVCTKRRHRVDPRAPGPLVPDPDGAAATVAGMLIRVSDVIDPSLASACETFEIMVMSPPVHVIR